MGRNCNLQLAATHYDCGVSVVVGLVGNGYFYLDLCFIGRDFWGCHEYTVLGNV